MLMNKLTHVDSEGGAKMVDVGAKIPQRRTARASGTIAVAPATRDLIRQSQIRKGDVFTVAQIAGIQAAKRTAQLIPLCHPLALNHVEISFKIKNAAIEVWCTTETSSQTGVELEALTGVSVAALTLYDMCKAVDKQMRIEGIRVVKKVKE